MVLLLLGLVSVRDGQQFRLVIKPPKTPSDPRAAWCGPRVRTGLDPASEAPTPKRKTMPSRLFFCLVCLLLPGTVAGQSISLALSPTSLQVQPGGSVRFSLATNHQSATLAHA